MKVSQAEEVKSWETDKGLIHIREEYCKGCGSCIEFCPRGVLEESEDLNKKGYRPPVPTAPEECVNCGLCERVCPDFAIWISEKSGDEFSYDS
ncbi:MAG: 4Fe-4S dicluster domain-containing protein [Candidatus Bipolaricaulota bacterium]|nr:ferredoxin family protein [Candidatus Bipolaricaulota bacterium]